MSRFWTILAWMVTSILPLPALAQDAPPAEGSGKPMIAIVPLKGEGRGQFGDQHDEMYQKATQAFFQTRRFDLMERGQLSAVLGEAKFQSSGLVDDATAVALGKQLGVKFIVLGSFNGNMSPNTEQVYNILTKDTRPATFWAGTANINLRMVNVETGKIQETFVATGTSKDANATKSLTELLKDLAVKLNREVSNKFPLTGFVIKLLGEKEAVIDLGSKDGVGKGDQFAVVQRGEDIVHPVTGRVIRGQKKIITELKVTSVDEETATVKITGDKVPLKLGLGLESIPKKAGIWESLKDNVMK